LLTKRLFANSRRLLLDRLVGLICRVLEGLDPFVGSVHRNVHRVVGAVLLRHPEDANGKNRVGNPSEVVVGLPPIGGSRATELPDLRHTPGGTTSPENFQDELEEETKEESNELGEDGESVRVAGSPVLEPGMRVNDGWQTNHDFRWVANTIFTIGIFRMAQKYCPDHSVHVAMNAPHEWVKSLQNTADESNETVQQ
jgi:hypothetical protein